MEPKRYVRLGLVISTILLIILLVPTNVGAENGTDTIQEDYYKAHTIFFLTGDSITITYTMQVTDGPNIDVFLLDSDNYQYLQDGQEFEYLLVGTDLNTAYTSKTLTLDEQDTYYLVFDNTDIETDPPWNMVDDTAYVSWSIDTQIEMPESDDDDDDNGSTPGFEIILLLGAIIGIAFYLRKRK